MDRDEFLQNLKVKIDELNEAIDDLEAKVEQAEGMVKDAYSEKIDLLRAKREQLEERLFAIASASKESWADLKQGAEEAFEALKSAVDDAVAHWK